MGSHKEHVKLGDTSAVRPEYKSLVVRVRTCTRVTSVLFYCKADVKPSRLSGSNREEAWNPLSW